jgi:biotin carboxyl carrier protein
MKLHVKIQDKLYEVRVGDIMSRPIQVMVEGETFEIWPQEVMTSGENLMMPQPISAPQVSEPVNLPKDSFEHKNLSDSVKAPIPGVIVEINVKEGDSVSYGQELCVLEAMKMKNLIRASKAGIISKIHIQTGDQVSQNQLLMDYQKES